MPKRRSFGQLRRLPSKRWQAFYTGPDTALHYAPSTFETKMDAEAWLVDERRIISSGAWVAPSERHHQQVTSVKLDAYAAAWLADRPLKPRTREHYRGLLDRQILTGLGDKPLRALTPVTIRTWHAELGTKTPTTRAHAYGLLRTILATAVHDGLIAANPCHIRGAGSSKRVHKVKPATLDELEVLVANMPERYQAMTLLAAWCGLRFGELTELRRGDLDMRNGRIKIRRAVVRVDEIPDPLPAGIKVCGCRPGCLIGPPKSEAGVRDVSIPPHLLPVAKSHLSEYAEFGRDSLLFPGINGAHLTPSSLYGRAPGARDAATGRKMAPWGFYAARAAAGRPDLRWHDLRHTGAVLAAATGATLAELMARLGHSTQAAALRYQHAAQDRDAEIARKLSEMVK